MSAGSQIIYHISNGDKIVSSCKCKLKIIKVVNSYTIFFPFLSLQYINLPLQNPKKIFSNSCFRYVFLFFFLFFLVILLCLSYFQAFCQYLLLMQCFSFYICWLDIHLCFFLFHKLIVFFSFFLNQCISCGILKKANLIKCQRFSTFIYVLRNTVFVMVSLLTLKMV